MAPYRLQKLILRTSPLPRRVPSAPASQIQKIPEDCLPGDGQDGLGVKLNAVNGQLLVAKPHDLALGGLGVISRQSGRVSRFTMSEW